MTKFCRRALLLLCSLLPAGLASAHAQTARGERLHVLRIVPSDPAEPTDSVVVTFDRPVAPALDRSVDPAGVVRVSPAAAHSAYWRDPSSLVVVFDRPWSLGAAYRVDVVPTLRSADGRRIAAREGGTIRVRQQRVLAIWPALRADGNVAMLQRPRVVLEAPAPLLSFVGRSWLVPYRCGWERDSIALRPESIAPLDTSDVRQLSRRDDANAGLDSLRRVVRFVAERELPRECAFVMNLPADVVSEDPHQFRGPWRTAPIFRLDTIGIAHGMQRDGHVALYFNAQVTGAEVRRAVRVGGRVPTLWQAPFTAPGGADPSARRSLWLLADSLASGQSIEVVVQRGLRDVDGEELGAEVRRVVERPHASPSVSFVPGLVVVPRDAGVLLVVSHVNADSVAVEIARVPEAKRVAALQEGRWYQQPDWNPWGGEVVTRTIAVASTLDSTRSASIPASLLPDGWRDDPLLVIRARPIVGEKYRALASRAVAPWMRAVVQRTNLAAHASGYEGRGEVWVTALRSAAPVRNARVRVVTSNGRELATSVTDSLGRAQIDYRASAGEAHSEALIDVTSGTDRVLAAIAGRPPELVHDDDDGGQWSQPGARKLESGKQLHGAAFSERGIYRPGERVYLDGVMRTFEPYGDWATPAGDSARWTIHWMGDAGRFRYRWDSSVERMQRHAVALSAFGTTADTFDIPRTAKLGEYHAALALKTSFGWRTAAVAQFAIAEYRPTEFTLALESDSAIRLFAGDTAHVLARARYLFGMPMTNAKLSWFARVSEGESSVAGLRALAGYRVGRSWWRLPEGQQPKLIFVKQDSAVLDDSGRVAIALPVSTLWPTGAMQLAVTATDANRQTVTTERKLVVHGADAYVGIRTRSPRWYWNAGDTIPVELVVTRLDGSLRPDAHIALAAVRYAWREGQWRADTVWNGEARMIGAPATVSWVPKESGWYELLATTHDDRGRPTTSGMDLWVFGPRNGRIASERRGIQLSLDRQRYAPGDVISAIIDSPVDQRAWVSLSRSAPLHEQFVSLHAGPNVVKVPVPVGAIPRAELRVVGVTPLGTGSNDRESLLATTARTIEVSAASRELAVRVIADRSRYAPGEPVHVRVKVSDANGKAARAETTIWAVDQGVGLLTGLEKPDLLGDLLGTNVISPWQGSSLEASVLGLSPMPERQVMLRVRGMRTRSDLSGSVSGVNLEQVVVTAYGEERRATASVRRHFATTPLFVGGAVTDSAGVAEVSFTLPDNATTYRLFATAVSAGMEAGSGDTSLVSTRPVLIRAALPRAVRIGDSLFAGGVLTQDAEGTTPVSMHVETRGIDVRGATTRTDTLRGRAAREVRFPMRVVAGDSVTVRLRGGTASAQDAVELTLPVSAAGHPRAHVVSGTMQGRAVLLLPAVEGIDVERSRVTVQLGSSVLPLVRQLSDALSVYPYGCTEQLTSAGRALLARVTFERVTNPAATLGDADRRQLESIVSRIVARQQEAGGIGYWDQEGWTSPWLTAYATELLLDARAEGVEVPSSVTEHVGAYLVQSIPNDYELQVWTDRIREARTSHDLLASARVLRRLGQPSVRLESALERQRDRLAFVDRLAFARLRAMAGDSAGARRLLDGAWTAAHASGQKIALDDSTRGTGWLFESRLRAIASLAQATAELEPKHPMLGSLVESLVHRGRAERDWQWNTLDQSATADALAAARHIYGFGSTRRVRVSGPRGTLATSTFEAGRSDSVALPLAALLPATRRDSTPRIALAADTIAPIFYAATLFETPRARPVRADDEGISVERWYEGYDDGKPTTSVREGQLVRVRLRVTVTGDREFVAVEDPLPAGLEAVDLTLRTSATLPPAALARRAAAADRVSGGRGNHYWGWWSPWEHTEKRDDRVLYFSRQLPKGSWDISYVARATTAGNFVRPPAHAEEMYNPAVHGRSDGGWFTVTTK